MERIEKKPILGLQIDLGPCDRFVDRIVRLARQRRSAFVCLANVHMAVERYRNPDLAQALAKADLIAPDGMPLTHSLKWLHGVRQERVAGVDMLTALLKEAANQELSVFFYGETESVLASLIARAHRDFPRLRIAGTLSPPFRTLSVAEEMNNVAAINASGAQLVLVALGCPRQEFWMAQQKGHIHGVMVGLGAAFGMYAGVRRRAPEWMRRHSLEWFYRLLQEPRRLWRRYLITITAFLFLLGRELLAQKMKRLAN